MSPLELAIRDHAWSFVRGNVNRAQFMDWFAAVLMHEAEGDPVAKDLADDEALYDAEFTSGAGTEDDLRDAIRRRLHVYRTFDLTTEPEAAGIATGSDNLS